ncbi:uncharacterized protein [Physcomitrium patens]|uniref:uncharacterized protein isoform X2 n=1 Tax=Physcomitrium patens TaxID=3218 RepID=UPI003CCDE948
MLGLKTSSTMPSTSSLNSFASWCFELSSGLSEIASLLSSSACGFGLLKTASNATKNRPGLLPRNHPDLEEFGSSGFLLIEKRLNLVKKHKVFGCCVEICVQSEQRKLSSYRLPFSLSECLFRCLQAEQQRLRPRSANNGEQGFILGI